MKVSIDWLSDYIKLNKSAQEIADGLTMGIAEVEDILSSTDIFQGIVVGKVLNIQKHPNADRLSLVTVDLGEKKLKIICGANNLKIGQKVPVATLGTNLPNGMEIKKVEIRGVESSGMICSEQELGIKDKSKGIMVLPSLIKIGTEFSKYLGKKKDTILEIDNKSLTHRSDLFGHIGIARELGAIFNKKVNLPIIKKIKTVSSKENINIKVDDKGKCPRYMAVVLNNINIKNSPEWMQRRLQSCGVKPINNVVDITNYVLLEYGQPLHAFDYNHLRGDKKTITVRFARKNEKLKTLDEKERILTKNDLVIADKDSVIALAGIMGGQSTQVTEKTNKVILESANFDPYIIRRTAQRLALRTEALMRFEKGLSSYFTEEGMMRAIDLLVNYANAKVISKVYDINKIELKEKNISLNIEKINNYLGQSIKSEKVKSILKSLDFKVSGNNTFKVIPPVYRNDINITEDVIEEVARIYGYGNIKPITLKGALKPVIQEKDISWTNVISEILVGVGMSEVMNYSFYGDKLLKKSLLSGKDHIELSNPISKDLKYLRTSLLPGLFQNIEDNIKNFDNINIYEVGHVYFEECECKSLAGVVVGDKAEVYYQIKGIIELLLKKLNINFSSKSIKKDSSCEYFNMYADGTCLKYLSEENLLGTIALADNRITENFDLKKKKVGFFNLSIDELVKLANKQIQYKKIPKYPSATLDIAIVLDKSIKAETIEKEIKDIGKPLLKNIELFDIFTGKQIGKDKKSLAYHLEYRSDKKTLEEEDVENVNNKIIKNLQKKFHAKLRD